MPNSILWKCLVSIKDEKDSIDPNDYNDLETMHVYEHSTEPPTVAYGYRVLQAHPASDDNLPTVEE